MKKSQCSQRKGKDMLNNPHEAMLVIRTESSFLSAGGLIAEDIGYSIVLGEEAIFCREVRI